MVSLLIFLFFPHSVPMADPYQDCESPTNNDASDNEDGVSLVDSVSNGGHQSLFTNSEGYFSRYAIK